MSVNGSWNITMSTPLGPQSGELFLNEEEGGLLTGYMDQKGNKSDIEEGTISEDGDLFWKISVKKPMKISAAITAKYDGEGKITGEANLGFIGNATLEALRA